MEGISYQSSKTLNSFHQNDGGRKKKYKKRHVTRQKYRRKHTEAKHYQKPKYNSNLSNLQNKQKNYSSEYIGSKRLTKHMGFLGKGKISDSISRYENTLPDNLRARANQDLHRVLRISNNSNRDSQQIPDVPSNWSFNKRPNSDQSSSCSSRHSLVQNAEASSRTVEPNHIPIQIVSEKRISPVDKVVDDNLGASEKENKFCSNVIKRLHHVIANTNASLFPDTSNKSRLISEFLSIKKEYNSRLKSKTSSNPCTSKSSHQRMDDHERSIEDDFELNPVLTQESVSSNLQSIFPDSQTSTSDSDVIPLNLSYMNQNNHKSDFLRVISGDMNMSHSYAPSDEDMEMDVVLPSVLQNADIADRFSSQQSHYSSARAKQSIYNPASPVSVTGSPVWVRKPSPLMFKAVSAPTPKLYYRQKMF